MPGRMEFTFGFNKHTDTSPKSTSEVFNLLVIGNFSGRQDSTRIGSISSVDMDNFEHTINLLLPTVKLELPNSDHSEISIDIASLEDFHPDRLFRKLSIFKALRELRRRLADPNTFAEAAAEFNLGNNTNMPIKTETAADTSAKGDTGESMFADLIGGKPVSGTADTRISSNVQNFIHDIVADHIQPGIAAEQKVLLDAIDESISDTMRLILHTPAFQQLEARWRGLDKFISRVSVGEDIKLHILDIDKQSLSHHVEQFKANLGESTLYQRIIGEHGETLGGQNWSLIVGDYHFDASEQDVQLLAAMGTIAKHGACSFVAGANTELVGCASLFDTPDSNQWQAPSAQVQELWSALRTNPVADAIGLVATDVIMRLPYGENTNEIDSFTFEEIIDPCDEKAMQSNVLWVNGGIMCAIMIGQSVEQYGPQEEIGIMLDVDNLPAYTYKCYGPTKLYPCAQILMTEATAARLMQEGLMSFRSYKDQNKIRLTRLQSIASPVKALLGPW